MAAAQRAAATNGPDPDPGPDPGTGAGFCQSTVSILDNHVLDNHVWIPLIESMDLLPLPVAAVATIHSKRECLREWLETW